MSLATASYNLNTYGLYPVSRTFDSNDVSQIDCTPIQPRYAATPDTTDSTKKHSACDECRGRKLKCSGESTGCARCGKQNLTCRYSEQKPMGRPRKRRRLDFDNKPAPMQDDSTVSHIESGLTHSQNNPGLITPNISVNTTLRDVNSCNYLNTTTVISSQYPTDIANWDFSIHPLTPEDQNISCDPHADPSILSNLPPNPACPCLPSLYLTLSNLSTLSSFPFTPQTIDTITQAYRTARDVIYCTVCPQRFDTGSSNFMLSCALITVLVDQWSRWRRLSASDVRDGFGTAEQRAGGLITTRQGVQWRTFQDDMVRAYVVGDSPIPNPPDNLPISPAVSMLAQCDDLIEEYPELTLLVLQQTLMRRQRQWHFLEDPTDEFPDRVTPGLYPGHIVGGSNKRCDGTHLCLEIVGQSGAFIEGLVADLLPLPKMDQSRSDGSE